MKIFEYLFILLFFSACDMHLEISKPENVYIIPEGRHSSTHSFKGFEGTSLIFEAKFDDTAIYSTQDPANQADINKLMGFSSCNSHHHQNSARIGWRWFNDRVEIFGYTYFEGQRVEAFITEVPLNKLIQYEIRQQPDGYYFRVGDKELEMSSGTGCMEKANYILWPYFGGNETAPHDIKIEIQSIVEVLPDGSTNLKNG